jgi:cold shock CspA family protein
MEGVVLFFDRKRGYGFAAPADQGGDIYIHASQLPKDHRWLNEDDRVLFDVGPVTQNHRVALRVQIITEAPQSGARS